MEKSPAAADPSLSLTQPDSFKLLDPIGAAPANGEPITLGPTFRYSVKRLTWTWPFTSTVSGARAALTEDHEALSWQHRDRGPIQRTNIATLSIIARSQYGSVMVEYGLTE